MASKSRKDERTKRKIQKLKVYLELAKSNDLDRQMWKRKRESEIVPETNEDDVAAVKRVKDEACPDNKEDSDNVVEQSMGNGETAQESKAQASRKLVPPKPGPMIDLGVEDLKTLKSELVARRNKIMNQPKFYLTGEGKAAAFDLNGNKEEICPVFVNDIQHLLLKAFLGAVSPSSPRWCELLRFTKISNIVVLLVDGLPSTEYGKNLVYAPNMAKIFDNVVEITPPSYYGSRTTKELLWVGLTNRCKDRIFKEKNSIGEAIKRGLIVQREPLKDMFNIKDGVEKESPIEQKFIERSFEEGCTKISLLLSPQQMFQESFPLPGSLSKLGNKIVPTKESYDPVTNTSPMYGVDCEMCLTTNRLNELTRVTIVGEKMELIYDTLVKPKARITNYLTEFSGITPAMMMNCTTTIEDVQQKFRELLPADAILVGQSLSSDMTALEMSHPYVIDTSVIYNQSGTYKFKTGLKKLTKIFLNEDIQNHGADGHDSFEDSAYALKLVLLKLRNGLKFGDVRWLNKPKKIKVQIKEPPPPQSQFSMNLLKYVEVSGKKLAIVNSDDAQDFNTAFKAFTASEFVHRVKASNSRQVAKSIEHLVTIYDLCIGHMEMQLDSEELQQSSLQHLDGAVKRIYDACPANSLIIIATEDKACLKHTDNGLCFVKIKTSI